MENFDFKTFLAEFNGRDPNFLNFLTLERNKDLFKIIKAKKEDLTRQELEVVKDSALSTLKLQYASLSETVENQDTVEASLNEVARLVKEAETEREELFDL